MTKNMPTPDIALKNFFKDNNVFADLFNGYFFKNEKVIDPDELETDDIAYAITVEVNSGNKGIRKKEKINKYRDNIRRTSLGYLVILGIEDQNKIHYSMPVRKILYDALGYTSEVSALVNIQDKGGWTVDEWLSKTAKGTKITPIITVVFYTGEKPWDGPCSLHDMMQLDEKVKPFVPDYPLYIIDIGHDKRLSFSNKFLSQLKESIFSVYSETANTSEVMIDNSILALTGVLTNNRNLYFSAIESEKGEQKMCEAWTKWEEEIRARVSAEKDDVIAEKDAVIAEKNAMIEKLKKELQSKR